jgi:hypothetical protein
MAQMEEFLRNQQHPRHSRRVPPGTITEEDEHEHLIDDDNHFLKRVVKEAMYDLFVALPNVKGTRIVDCEINLSSLQRMNIYAIQRHLVHLTKRIVSSRKMEVVAITANDEDISQARQLRELMKEYCE